TTFIGMAWRTIALAGALAFAVTPPVRAAGEASRGSSAAATAAGAPASAVVSEVAAVGMTVSDMERSVDFYTGVLWFRKVSDTEVVGEAYDRIEGEFGARSRVVRLQLGDEQLELTQYLAPEGRAFPPGSRGNDRWFQHVAIIVSDMDQAY